MPVDLVYNLFAEVGMRDATRSRVAKMLIAAALAAALGGCFHIPARAWANGRELGYTQESAIIYGPHNPTAARQLHSAVRSSAMGWQIARPSPFGNLDWGW